MAGLKHQPYTKFMAWMKENNVSNNDIADLLAVHKSVVSKRLNGTGADFSIEEVRIICVHYGISADTYFVAYKVS